MPDGGGIPRSWSTDVLATPFNDVEQVVKVVERYHREISAILIEPLQRCILPEPDFFEVIRNLATKYGIIIIFDEIVTGFRMAWGGAQERYKLTPDLAVYGKTISGGYPVAAICGRADVMEVMNGWRPADDPKRVVVVIVRNSALKSRYGGIIAAPVFSEVIASNCSNFLIRFLGSASLLPACLKRTLFSIKRPVYFFMVRSNSRIRPFISLAGLFQFSALNVYKVSASISSLTELSTTSFAFKTPAS